MNNWFIVQHVLVFFPFELYINNQISIILLITNYVYNRIILNEFSVEYKTGIFWESFVSILWFSHVYIKMHYDSLYFLHKLIVIHSFVETDRTEIFTPRLSIVRNLHHLRKIMEVAIFAKNKLHELLKLVIYFYCNVAIFLRIIKQSILLFR